MALSRLLVFLEFILVADYANGQDYCSSMMDKYGLSSQCSSISLAGADKLQNNYFPSGGQVNFNMATYIRECMGRACVTRNQKCSIGCQCCQGYSGADPGFQASIWAPNDASSTYTQFLTCDFPPYVANPQGFYFFSCIFKGYGLASTSNLVQIQLRWTNMPNSATINFSVYITAGNVSLPDCLWTWERGNKFPVNEYGIFRILLYDAYGNKVSAVTGGTEPNINLDATFQKLETNGTKLETSPTFKITYQHAYGFCIITIYAKKAGKFSMTVRDDHNIIMGNMPSVFYVLPDESWTGTRFKPPPAPKTYFLGDNYVGNAGIYMTMNLWLIICMLLCTLVVVLEIPFD